MTFERSTGAGIRLYRGRFRPNRWTGNRGYGREGDGTRWRRLRVYQWPFGVIHVLGRWSHGGGAK